MIKKSCFNGRRIVVFSGGEAKNDNDLLDEVRAIKEGGGNGSIVGRNCFQRSREKAFASLMLIFGYIKLLQVISEKLNFSTNLELQKTKDKFFH